MNTIAPDGKPKKIEFFRRPHLEIPRSVAGAGDMFQHKEAFALMKYANNSGTHIEWIWNSRDGVTPFGCQASKDYCDFVRVDLSARGIEGEEYGFAYFEATNLHHEDWHLDRCLPFYKPCPGERVFIDYTEAMAREYHTKNVNDRWLSDSEASIVFQQIEELRVRNAPFFERCESDLQAWVNSMKESGKIVESPKYDETENALVKQMTTLQQKVSLREQFSSKESAIEMMTIDQMQTPGQPTVITGEEFRKTDPICIAETAGFDLVLEYASLVKTSPDDGPKIEGTLRKYSEAQDQFAKAIMDRNRMIHPDGVRFTRGGTPILNPRRG